jgi:hypothetical protein
VGIAATGFCHPSGILQLFHRQDQQILRLPTAVARSLQQIHPLQIDYIVNEQTISSYRRITVRIGVGFYAATRQDQRKAAADFARLINISSLTGIATYYHGSDQVNHLGVLHICIQAVWILIKPKVATHIAS